MEVGQTSSAAIQKPPGGGSLPGTSPRGPLKPPAIDPKKLASKVDVRLSGPLRLALTDAARKDGITDGAYLRRLVADNLGVASEEDRASGPRQRIPDADLVVLSGVVREVGALYGPARAGQVETVLAGLDKVRGAILPMVIGLAGRPA